MYKLLYLSCAIILWLHANPEVEGATLDGIFVFDSTSTEAECACEKAALTKDIIFAIALNNTNLSVRIGLVYYDSSSATIAYGLSRQLNSVNILAAVAALPCSGGTTGALDVALGWAYNMFFKGGQPLSRKYINMYVSHQPTTPTAVTVNTVKLVTLGAVFSTHYTTNAGLTPPINGVPITIPQVEYTSYCNI